jgi:hypothetical protein
MLSWKQGTKFKGARMWNCMSLLRRHRGHGPKHASSGEAPGGDFLGKEITPLCPGFGLGLQ